MRLAIVKIFDRNPPSGNREEYFLFDSEEKILTLLEERFPRKENTWKIEHGGSPTLPFMIYGERYSITIHYVEAINL